MIEIKKSIGSFDPLFFENVYVLDTSILSAGTQQYQITWNNRIIIYATIQNNTNIDFVDFGLIDNSAEALFHPMGIHAGCYSITFAGNNSGQPNTTTQLNNLDYLFFTWNFPGQISSGSITVKLYSKII